METHTQRRHERHRTAVDCTVCVLEESSRLMPAVIIDASETGLAVLCSESIPVGTLVSVKYGKTVAMGEVRSCQITAHGFRTGIQIEDRD